MATWRNNKATMEEEKVAVATIGMEIYRAELNARKHLIVADEPEDGVKT